MDYTHKEMMTIVAAREIRNDDIVFCGTGISMLAAMAAKNINAPQSVIFFDNKNRSDLVKKIISDLESPYQLSQINLPSWKKSFQNLIGKIKRV